MMLFKLFVLRLAPLMCLGFCKKRKQIKIALLLFLVCYGGIAAAAIWKIFSQEHWKGALYLPVSMFPQYLFYGFAVWMILRCLLHAWSERVWKRIYKVAIVVVTIGVLTEKYWNSLVLANVLQIF